MNPAPLKVGDRATVDVVVVGVYGDRVNVRSVHTLELGGVGAKPGKSVPAFVTVPAVDVRPWEGNGHAAQS